MKIERYGLIRCSGRPLGNNEIFIRRPRGGFRGPGQILKCDARAEGRCTQCPPGRMRIRVNAVKQQGFSLYSPPPVYEGEPSF